MTGPLGLLIDKPPQIIRYVFLREINDVHAVMLRPHHTLSAKRPSSVHSAMLLLARATTEYPSTIVILKRHPFVIDD